MIRHALSPSQLDVRTAVDASSDGDTVIIPPGSAIWKQGLDLLGKEITLQGATTVAGNDENSYTTVASGSDGANIASLPSATLFVTDASKLPPAPGRVYVETSASNGAQGVPADLMVLSYTGRDIGLNKLTGCAPVTGFLTYPLTGTVSMGMYVIGIIATDNTVIFDDAPNAHLITTTQRLPGVNLLRISGVTFARYSSNAGADYLLSFSGYTEKFRVDNCHFHNLPGKAILTNGQAGVMDHCVFYDNTNDSATWECHFQYWRSGSGQPDKGDNVFHDDSLFGSKYSMHMESSLHFCMHQVSAIPDTEMGGRAVLRHCIIANDASRGHGTEASNNRGARLREVYKCSHIRTRASLNTQPSGSTLRGGVLLHWGNTYDSRYGAGNPCCNIVTFRGSEQPGNPNANSMSVDVNPIVYSGTGTGTSGQWGGCDGRGPWDINATEPDGTHVPGHADHGRFFRGTVTTSSPSGSTVTLSTSVTVSGATVTANQYRYYEIINVTPGSNHINGHTQIDSHTATSSGTFTMTLKNGAGRGDNSGPPNAPLPVFAVGDTIEIWKPVICIDQGGRGKSDLPNWSNPSWLNGQLEPVYAWLNRRGTSPSAYPIGTLTEATSSPNRDYYNEVSGGQQTSPTSPFDGSVGIGWGTLANRPTTGTNGSDPSGSTTNPPGVAYWATDTPSANGSSDVGALYVWRGGAWVLYYQPYTYPHLLTGVTTPVITSSPSATFTEGVGGTFQAGSAGFSAAPTWDLSVGNLPSGTSLNNSTGLLTVGSGTAAGTYAFTIRATNGSEVASQPFTLTVTAAPTRVITLSPSSLAFGNVDINTTSRKDLTITNDGNVVLTVTNITLPTGFVAGETSFTVAPGASHLVNITFSPIVAGAYSGTATVVSDKTSGTNTAPVSGFSATRVMGLSGDLAFGDVTVGQMATRQLTINNSGDVTLNISAIGYPPNFSGDFSSAAIAAGGSKILNITFSPDAAQAYAGTVDITSDKTSGTSSIATGGNGVATTTKIIQLTSSLDFGTVQTGTTATKTLTLTNSGNASLNVSGITYPTGFTGSYAGAIAAGASQDVVVTFSPVAAISYSGTVTVASDATGGINTTTASGTGSAASTKIIALSGPLAFGNVLVSSTTTLPLSITNNGTTDLSVTSITLPTGFSGTFAGSIAPGATQSVTVTFAPTGVQDYSGNVTVTSDATSGTNTIAASGTGVAPATKIISITGDLNFGNVQRSHSAQKIMTITNSGTVALTVTGITFPTAFTGNWSSGSIRVGGSQNVTVTFRPTAAQNYGGNITVASDKTSGINTIACSGTGRNKRQVPFIMIVG